MPIHLPWPPMRIAVPSDSLTVPTSPPGADAARRTDPSDSSEAGTPAVPPAPAAAIDSAPQDPGTAASTGALVLYASMLCARSLDAAAHALVVSVAARFGFSRATIALHRDHRTRLLASSHLDLAKPRGDVELRLLGAMDEAIDQAVSLAWPPQGDGDAGDPIRVEHQALQRQVMAAVATVPLGQAGDVFGAVCVERDLAQPFTPAELADLEHLLSLAAPALRWMQQGQDTWIRRMRADLLRAWLRLRQPDRVVARRLIAAGALLLAFLALAPLQREVGGRARVEGAEQRVLVAPVDGFIKQAHVRPGDQVDAGAVLVDMLDSDLRLERERWTSQLAQHENAYAGAMAKAERTTASTSLARITEAQSQLALVDDQLSRARVVAPFGALVIQGDLSQSIGAPVRQGDPLLTLATTGRHRVIVEVDEVDIARVGLGQAGQLALSSLPWDRHDLVVERITPLAKAVDGRNVFEVEARLLAPSAALRPGLLGRADIVVGRLPPLWAWTSQALDRMRVAFWSWLG